MPGLYIVQAKDVLPYLPKAWNLETKELKIMILVSALMYMYENPAPLSF